MYDTIEDMIWKAYPVGLMPYVRLREDGVLIHSRIISRIEKSDIDSRDLRISCIVRPSVVLPEADYSFLHTFKTTDARNAAFDDLVKQISPSRIAAVDIKTTHRVYILG